MAGSTSGNPIDMAGGTQRLAGYATALRYDDIPPAVLRRAKDCLIETVAAAVLGHDFTWSRIVLGLARNRGPGWRRSSPGRKC